MRSGLDQFPKNFQKALEWAPRVNLRVDSVPQSKSQLGGRPLRSLGGKKQENLKKDVFGVIVYPGNLKPQGHRTFVAGKIWAKTARSSRYPRNIACY
jgi:hypothetical protein